MLDRPRRGAPDRTEERRVASSFACEPLWLPSLYETTGFLRKEVIQPQVPLRLPCYDFTPIISHTLGTCLPCGLTQQLLVQPTFVV